MNVLMIGSGGREHALVKKLVESPRVTKLYTAPTKNNIIPTTNKGVDDIDATFSLDESEQRMFCSESVP